MKEGGMGEIENTKERVKGSLQKQIGVSCNKRG